MPAKFPTVEAKFSLMGAKQSTINIPSDDAALREIVEGVESETGDRFFYSLVKHLASALECQYAFVSELLGDRSRFRTRAVWGRGSFMENFEIPLDGTPCEAVLNGKFSHHPEQICQLFPSDTALKQWGVESYCGVPLLDSSGTVVGHLAILLIGRSDTVDRSQRDHSGTARLARDGAAMHRETSHQLPIGSSIARYRRTGY